MIPNEDRLIAAAQSGDAESFGRLYDGYAAKIHDYLYYRLHHRETAEDLTSRTFLKALEKLGTFDPAKGSFSGWIYRIARNSLIDHYRSDRPDLDIEDVWDALRDRKDLARDTETRERLAQVESAITVLPRTQRDVVIMRLWDELSYAEIAAITGKSEAACKMTFSRALAALRTSLPPAAFILFITNPFA